MAQNKFLDYAGLQRYDTKKTAQIDEKDAAVLASAKQHANDLASNYDPAGTAATKVQELANGAVKSNTDAIAAINDETSGILAQSKTYTDSKDSAIAAAKKAGTDAQATADAAQENVDALEEKIGTVEDGKTVMGIIAQIQENAYDDTDVRALIQSNTEDINNVDEKVDAVDGKVTTLVGDDAGKSARTIANEELAKQLIAEGAKESLDTLAEIAAWIQAHPDDASAMNKAIDDLEALVGTIPEGVTATTIVGYIQELVNAEAARARGVEDGLDSRLKTVETQLGDGTGSVTEQITNAKTEAINTAAADATAKANQSLTDSKKYTDEQINLIDLSGINTNATAISALQTRTSAAESDIDGLQAAIGDNGTVTNAIADAKKAGTDAQSDVDALETTVNSVSAKANANETNISTLQSTTSSHTDQILALEDKVGDGFVAISNTEIDGLFTEQA